MVAWRHGRGHILMQLFARTEQQQHRASDPAVSVWVSANAGWGKTHVLAQLVVRPLLRGVPPSKILCLTFTKAAAANMADKVFKTLGDWTRLDDEGLRRAILATGAPEATPATLSLARKLFARTVETPGGLKIQTIHAFCEKLLHLFPFEANVPARFETLEDMHQTELLARARRDVLAEAGAVKSPLRDHLERLAAECSGYAFEALIKEAMGHRAISRARWPRDPEAALRKALDLPRGRTGASIEREMIEDGIAPARWTEIAAFLDKGKKTDQDRAVLFRQAASAYAALRSNSAPGKDCLDIYCTIFFTQKGTPTVSLLTKDLAKAQPDFAAELYAEQARLTALRKTAKAAETFDRTLSLITIVDAIFQLYEKMKSARGLLDFDDLIERTQSLLTRSDARWVLYKLDSGIDHILVDEAQDTSEAQWKILEELTGDFASGESTAKAPRTFFAVGDEKQSIFSFQGAAPHMFHEMRRKFELRFKDGEQSFAHVPLKTSFRSARGILDTVDKVFDCAGHQVGLVAAGDVWMPHEALKEHLPGLVEIWPA